MDAGYKIIKKGSDRNFFAACDRSSGVSLFYWVNPCQENYFYSDDEISLWVRSKQVVSFNYCGSEVCSGQVGSQGVREVHGTHTSIPSQVRLLAGVIQL